MTNKFWIKGAINPAHKGALRRALGVKTGKNIPAGKLKKAAKKKGEVGRMARLAKTLAGFHKTGFQEKAGR